MQLLSIIAASNNGIIGINHQKKPKYTIPWTIPSDLKHFKTITEGNILIMGSKTYQSLPKVFFNNTSRQIILLTRNTQMTSDKKNVFMGYSKDHALRIAHKLTDNTTKKVIICGGKEIYSLFLSDITTWIISHVNACITLDSHNLDHENSKLIDISYILDHIKNDNKFQATILKSHLQNDNDEYEFTIVEYKLT